MLQSIKHVSLGNNFNVLKVRPTSTQNIINLFRNVFNIYGCSRYDLEENISLRYHCLRTAQILDQKKRSIAQQVAGVTHDIAHCLTRKPTEFPVLLPPGKTLAFDLYYTNPINPSTGIDDQHEEIGAEFLRAFGFPSEIYEPVRWHVYAKRYLYTINGGDYALSKGSKLSLQLQGGRLNQQEMMLYSKIPYIENAIELRLAEDDAKTYNKTGKSLDYYLNLFNKILG